MIIIIIIITMIIITIIVITIIVIIIIVVILMITIMLRKERGHLAYLTTTYDTAPPTPRQLSCCLLP